MEDALATGGAETDEAVSASADPQVPVDQKTPIDPNGIVVELPCGFVHEGRRYLYAEFVPMHGDVRKAISKKSIREDFAKVSDMVLRMCVKRLGPVETGNPKTLKRATLADRDFLLMEIRRESMSDKLRAIVDCPHCKKRIQVTFHLDEIEVNRLKEGGYEIVDGELCFRIQSPEHKLNALCRFPIGDDQDIVMDVLEENPTDAQYRLYAACLKEWNGKAGPFEEVFFDRVPVRQIDEFTRQFVDRKPGPVFEQHVPCPNKSCGFDIAFTFEGSDFFFPLPTRGRT